MLTLLGAGVIGYLLGSIPFGLLLTRLAGSGDIRRIGSGNIGATNVLRTGSKGAAALTLLLDLAKGWAAVIIGLAWSEDAALAAAGCVVIGHAFPLWLGFRGGKGLATALGVVIARAWPVAVAAAPVWLATAFGVVIALTWPVALVAALVWLSTALFLRYSSLAALVAAVTAAVLAPFFADGPTAVLIAGIALLIILRHHANIRRLIAGTESRISLTKG